MAVISFFPVCFRNHRNIILYFDNFTYMDSGCPPKQLMLQITPEITQDSLRTDTKDGGSFWIKGKGLCCKFFSILTHLISVINVVCMLMPWIISTQFCRLLRFRSDLSCVAFCIKLPKFESHSFFHPHPPPPHTHTHTYTHTHRRALNFTPFVA